MNRDSLSKLYASVFVLVMALSALAALPMANTSRAATQPDLSIQVLDTEAYTVDSATVALTNVHTGEVFDAVYSSGLYVVADAPSGYYRVDVTAADYYDDLNAISGGIRYDDLTPYVSSAVILEPLPIKDYTWNVTVENNLGQVVSGARVGFYDDSRREVVSEATTNSLGYALVDMYAVGALGLNIHLFVEKATYETHAEGVIVSANNLTTVELNKAKLVRGLVRDSENTLADDTVAYLVSLNPDLPFIKRVMKSDMGGSSYELYAYVDDAYDFVLCVDAAGLASNITTVSIPTGTTYILNDLVLENQTKRLENVALTYGSDFNSITMNVSTEWSYDDSFAGLMYGDVGSLRMQIDMNSETVDGAVDALEAWDFELMVLNYGSQYVTTSRLLTVNGTAYESSETLLSPSLATVEGSVELTDGLAYSYSCAYTSATALDVGAKDYAAVGYSWYDTPSVNHTYSVVLPTGYELVWNDSISSNTHVFVSGYCAVSLDPAEYVGGPVAVAMTFEKGERPSAGAGMVDSSEYVYAYMEDGVNVTKYFVKVGEEVNFTAEDSFDPNGNPLTYEWDFDDETSLFTTEEVLANHTYLLADASKMVNLTVVDVSGLVNWTEVEVVCDAMDPVPEITVKEGYVNESNVLEVNESELITLNATSSEDDAVAVGDGLGMIDFIEFSYGEGNTSGRVYWTEDEQNISFSYADAGTYNLTLNVTDVVGHWKNTTMTVRVNDTTGPTATFNVKNETWGSSLVEKELLYFDANATVDNVDDNANMTFSWYFGDDLGDDSWLNGTGLYNVTHTYEKTGNFAVKVNVTDLSDNYKSYTKRITVASGPRPDVRIDAITFDPDTFEEGQAGYIVVNLTNRGSAAATGVTLTFYIEHPDGTEELIGTWTQLLNGTTSVTTIEIGGTVQAKFPWTPDAKGSYSIRVNVTSTSQLEEDDSTDVVDVNEAGWKKIALWGGVVAVIVLVPLLFYLRGRWSKREKKGPRREKEEKRKGGSEEKL